MRLRLPFLCTALAVIASPAWPQAADASVLYRCPGNDYNNTISPSEAEKLGCKRVENANVTVIRSPVRSASAAAATPVPAAVAADARMPAENTALRTRASNARRDLENRLRTEERKLSTLEVAFAGGEPERKKEETNLQAYLDRVAAMRTEISRKQIEIAELRRELGKLPTR
ncbi:MAG: hypothetical protein ACXWUL_03835 [Caldimonas sp.]